MTRTQTDSEKQAQAQYESIADMVDALLKARIEERDEAIEAAEQAIQQDALAVNVRSDWHEVGAKNASPYEYMILLCTGGPAVRIIGTLNQHGEPETACIEHQDWGTPWTDYRMDSEQEQTVLTYAHCFYYGE